MNRQKNASQIKLALRQGTTKTMEISERYKAILSGMDSEDARLLKEVIGRSVDALQKENSEEELKIRFEETRRKIIEIEKKALKKLEERKHNPMCSFCLSSTENVEHMFKSEKNINHICSKCIEESYEKLQELRKP